MPEVWTCSVRGLVAIDGSKFKAVNSGERNFTQAKLQQRLQRIDEKVEQYLRQLDEADEAVAPPVAVGNLQEKIAQLQVRKAELECLVVQLQQSGETQISLTDPDARAMPKSPKAAVA